MEEGDAEANYAHFALQKLHILPSQFLNMDTQEKAFVIASINIRIDKEKEAEKQAKRKRR
ncbi:MAG: hypothetical protein K2G56_02060 [Eubacterium sp.]|nr:hypothetical protein [Eubacterium sp.]